ncbi:MAG: hypothetical protein AABX70_05740 [Nanoarchaeota archaeon]
MVSSSLIARLSIDLLQSKSALDEVLNELGAAQPPALAIELRKLFSYTSAGYSLLGMIYYDLTRSSFGRKQAGIIVAETFTTGCALDDCIDQGGYPVDKKISLLRGLHDTISTGNLSSEYFSPKVHAISLLAQNTHRQLSYAPKPDLFFQASGRVIDFMIRQIQGEQSLSFSEEFGAATMTLPITLPACYNESVPPHLLESAKCLGASLQLTDDVMDYEEDQRQGNCTFMTCASDPSATRTHAQRRSNELYQKSLDLLSPDERKAIETMSFLSAVHGFLFSNGILKSIKGLI